MNSNPSVLQSRYQNQELREMYAGLFGGACHVHHIFGSKTKFKLLSEAGIKKAGEWLVIALSEDDHDAIKELTFEQERALFIKQLRDYHRYYGEPSPVPAQVIKYYELMTSKHQGLKSWYA